MSNLVKYTLDADGKVRIPVGSAGKKQLTINKLNDEINNIPDTSSISVEIESKQGLLPPARVTPKNEYPFSTTMNQGWENTMMGVPLECNGFIPDYIDTTNMTPGDRVYIVDPKHDDTSKYVLSENKTWAYAGNYNDPEVGGVEGTDYSEIASTLGGMWLMRQNSNDGNNAIPFEMKRKMNVRTKSGDVVLRNLINEGDIVFWSNLSTGASIYMLTLKDNERTLSSCMLTALGIESQQSDIANTYENRQGAWVLKSGETAARWIAGEDSGDILNSTSQVVESYVNDENTTKNVKSNLMFNPCEHEIFLHELEFDGTVDDADTIIIPNGTLTPLYVFRKATTSGMTWTYSYFDPETRKTKYQTKIVVKPGMAFWYDRRGTTPLTIKFQ